MSYSGALCLLGIRKVAHELKSEAIEVPQARRRATRTRDASFVREEVRGGEKWKTEIHGLLGPKPK